MLSAWVCILKQYLKFNKINTGIGTTKIQAFQLEKYRN